MKNAILSIIFFIIVLSIPYVVDAGVELEPKYNMPQVDWIDPNSQPIKTQEYYDSEDGLKCLNQIFQINQNGLNLPARKCQMPDGSWYTFLF